jgi:hypothetical protein
MFMTDGLKSYQDAYMKEYWTQKRLNKTIHIRHVHLQGDMNNEMERMNGKPSYRMLVCTSKIMPKFFNLITS